MSERKSQARTGLARRTPEQVRAMLAGSRSTAQLNAADLRPGEQSTRVQNIHTAHALAMGAKHCGCEHMDHFDDGQGHPYLGAEAGSRVAEWVGEICDACAAGHLAAWVVESPWPTEVMR